MDVCSFAAAIVRALLVPPEVSCRQKLPPAYVLNGALYLASRPLLEQDKSFLTSHTVGYVMPPERSVDIDTLMDWHWAEFLFNIKSSHDKMSPASSSQSQIC